MCLARESRPGRMGCNNNNKGNSVAVHYAYDLAQQMDKASHLVQPTVRRS